MAMVNLQNVRYMYTEYDMKEIEGRSFTESQLREVYRDYVGMGVIDKADYPYFEIWHYDILRSGLFVVTEEVNIELSKKCTCAGCIYFDVCGDSGRTTPCKGRSYSK